MNQSEGDPVDTYIERPTESCTVGLSGARSQAADCFAGSPGQRPGPSPLPDDADITASDAVCRCSKVAPTASGNSGGPFGTGEPINSLRQANRKLVAWARLDDSQSAA